MNVLTDSPQEERIEHTPIDVLLEQDEFAGVEEADPNDPPHENPQKRTYISIDGVKTEEISEEHREEIENRVADSLLAAGYPVESVGFVSEDTDVIELDKIE